MLDATQLQSLAEAVIQKTILVGTFIQGEVDKVTSSDIITKDFNSLVSYVDTTAEQMLVAELSLLLPQAGYVTEENTTTQDTNEAYTWIIDPLDGTTNFLKGIPHYSTSIALMFNGKIILGVVNDITQNTIYHAIAGHGAFANNRPIQVSKVENLAEAIIVTGFPYERTKDFEGNLAALTHFLRQSRGIRRLGSAALDLAYVASGKLEIYYESQLNIWDIAAGVLLVEEAGGLVSDIKGQANHLQEASVIVSNKYLHAHAVDILRVAHGFLPL
jgi:myo-inositol-1(or 4)-monophosphatase